MPLRQSYVDPNTGATYPVSWVVWRDNNVDFVNQIVDITYQRFASVTTYSTGFQPIQTVGTQVQGQTYASFFHDVVAGARASFVIACQGATGSYLSAAPEFSGATFF